MNAVSSPQSTLAAPVTTPSPASRIRPSRTRTFIAAVLFLGISAATATAAPGPEKLRCYKIKDDIPKATYTATVTPDDLGLAISPGCEIRVPPKLFCVQAGTSDFSPTPPGAPFAPYPSRHFCYKMKCDDTPATAAGSDEFGTHHVSVGKTSMICVPIVPVCGNEIVDQYEQCDDGNLTDGDGCSSGCIIETTCGDGIVGGFEQCDDGNNTDGDGCSASCYLEAVCGNHITEFPEECDDGNMNDGDGCSHDCLVEHP